MSDARTSAVPTPPYESADVPEGAPHDDTTGEGVPYVDTADTAEGRRLAEADAGEEPWRRWGPYLSERAWGSVREDADPELDPWLAFPHDHARSRAYRWNEDGIGGLSDDQQRLCMAVALWNGKDAILKERMFGLTGPEGNHAEDVKEYYFFLDGTPTMSYLKMLYRYPNVEFPYVDLVQENARRTKHDDEYELVDALREDFAAHRWTDITIEYAKSAPDDIYCRITAHNKGAEATELHLLPHLWARNTWSWDVGVDKPELRATGPQSVAVSDPLLGELHWYVGVTGGARGTDGPPVSLLFTENNSNRELLGWGENESEHVKDGIHRHVVLGEEGVVGSESGTKVAAHVSLTLQPNESVTVLTRLTRIPNLGSPLAEADSVFEARIRDADEFHNGIGLPSNEEVARIQRQAFAGLLWTLQYYAYDVTRWTQGDPNADSPFVGRPRLRNPEWAHLRNHDVVSMPDSWEYPWYAVWDTAFHMVPFALMDPGWAKQHLLLFLRDRYQHPNGQIPAYEWNFSDVNPPVHAWSVWRVYRIDQRITGRSDTDFLERAFHKLMLNFTWWVNRKDPQGRGVFTGGFLGLDNIGVFDRSREAPLGGRLEQSDSTAWMAMYCLNLLAISLELAQYRPVYEDIATKFLEHFVQITNAAYDQGLWDEEDGFFHDILDLGTGPDGEPIRVPLEVRSLVGLIPLLAVETIDQEYIENLPEFQRRLESFAQVRPQMVERLGFFGEQGKRDRRMLSLVSASQLRRILAAMLDEDEFLSPWGIRSMSRVHHDRPYQVDIGDARFSVAYEPAEARNHLFGGNSNWRGPIWFPANFILIEALQKYHHFLGDDFTVDLPTAGGTPHTLDEVADDLSRRLVRIFTADEAGARAVFGGEELFLSDPEWTGFIPFYEYFNGDTGAGLGASHQTGWTATVAKLIHQTERRRAGLPTPPRGVGNSPTP